MFNYCWLVILIDLTQVHLRRVLAQLSVLKNFANPFLAYNFNTPYKGSFKEGLYSTECLKEFWPGQ